MMNFILKESFLFDSPCAARYWGKKMKKILIDRTLYEN
jgi:hypothetical protein